MIGYSSRALNTDALQALQIQNAHGFVVGQIVRHNGAQWVLAQADSIANSSGICMVSIVVDPNSFYITQTGLVNNIVQVLPTGVQLYLSPTVAGELTSTRPTTVGQCIVACAKAITASEAYFYTGPQILIESDINAAVNVTTATQALQPNTTYYVNYNAGVCTLTLPANAPLDSWIEIIGGETISNAYVIAQLANQYIRMISNTTTVGIGGTLTADDMYNSIILKCNDTAGTGLSWTVTNAMGSFTGV